MKIIILKVLLKMSSKFRAKASQNSTKIVKNGNRLNKGGVKYKTGISKGKNEPVIRLKNVIPKGGRWV